MKTNSNQPLRVGIDARLASGTSGGVEQVVLGLARGLAQLDGPEEYLFLVRPGAHDWLEPELGANSRVIPVSGHRGRATSFFRDSIDRHAPTLAKNLRRAIARVERHVPWAPVSIASSDGTLERSGAEVVHFTFQSAFETELPSIYHPHDLQFIHYPQYFSRRDRIARTVRYQRFCDRASLVGVTASWGRKDLHDQLGVSLDKIAVVPWAPVNTGHAPPDEQTLTRIAFELALPSGFVLYPAQTWQHKNHLGLLEALAQLRDQGVHVPLICTGRKNEFFETIAGRAQALGLEHQVRFLGFVTAEQLRSLYSLATLVCVPTFFEAASFPVWEAFLAGTPVACSNVTSLPAQVGDAALVFDPHDTGQIASAIRRLWSDQKLREIYANRGRDRVQRFSWLETARVFRALYRKLAGRYTSPHDLELIASALNPKTRPEQYGIYPSRAGGVGAPPREITARRATAPDGAPFDAEPPTE